MKSLFIYLQNLLTNFLPKQIKYKIDSVKDSLGLTWSTGWNESAIEFTEIKLHYDTHIINNIQLHSVIDYLG
jgi:hypothetical protein